MNLLINGISLREGGGLLVLRRFVEGFHILFPQVHLHVIIHRKAAHYKEFQNKHVKLHFFPYAEKNPLLKRIWYDFVLPAFSKRIRADILFSLTNYLPSRLKTPSLLLVQNAGHFSKIFERMHFEAFPGLFNYMAWRAKTNWVCQSMKNATMITVQTRSLLEMLPDRLKLVNNKVKVVPHGPGACNLIETTKSFPKGRPWRLGYITMYGVQKNFKTLFQAIAELQKQGREMILVLCLDTKNKKNRELLDYAERLGIDGIIENHGDVSFDEVQKIYQSIDLFIYPSLCESFGFSMVEAMACAIPVIAADVPGNREIIGSAGSFFLCQDHLDLAEKITRFMDSENAYNSASDASLKMAFNYSWQRTVENTMKLIEQVSLKGQLAKSIA